MRWVVSWLIGVVVPAKRMFPRAIGMVIELSMEEGKVVRVLQDPDGRHISGVSGVVEWRQQGDGDDSNGKRVLYMGHLMGNYISVVDV